MKNFQTAFFKIFKLQFLFLTILLMMTVQQVSGQTNIAPTVTATGAQQYCPGTPLPITTAFGITDPDDTTAQAVYIQIAAGYINGQDQLSLSTPVPNVSSQWNAATAKLTLSGVGGQQLPLTTLENAVALVVYTNTSANPTSGTRTFSITIGDANYLPSTQHYYRYVSSAGITWTTARAAAESATYYGLQGYLATLLSADEAQLCGEQTTGNGWIGASDAAQEGVWKWVTGPEAGTTFWNGAVNGSTPNYAKWNTNEPNNQGEEDYAHITSPGVGIPGSWNDLPNGGSSGDYVPKGYIIEFGGMPGDPVLNISASTTINVARITSTTGASLCGSGSVTLQAVTSGNLVYWYANATGGSPISTGSSFTTPNLTTTTTFYASAYPDSCTTGPRTAVQATIKPLPALTAVSPVYFCAGSAGSLSATPSQGIVRWYSSATGGTVLFEGTNYNIGIITENETFYAEAFSDGCASATRTKVDAVLISNPPIQVVPVAPLCGPGTVTLDAGSYTGTVKWYDSFVGGTLLYTGNTFTTDITVTTSFYAQGTIGSCTSDIRTTVTAVVTEIPAITTNGTTYICVQGTADLTATAQGETIHWYNAATAGTLLYTGENFTTPNLTQSTTFYTEVEKNGCKSAARTPVEVIIEPLPTIAAIVAPVYACYGESVTLQATPSAGTAVWFTTDTGGEGIYGNQYITMPVLETTTFYVGAESHGCISETRLPVTINVEQKPQPQDENIQFCQDASTTITAGIPSIQYKWSTGETTENIEISEAGTYTVTITNAAGCSAIKTIIATTVPNADIVRVEVNTDVATVIMADPTTERYQFSLDGQTYRDSNVFGNLTAGVYTVFVKSRNGCGSDFINFTVNLLPEFFTPNGDNVNDRFTMTAFNLYPGATITIFDRYGKLITGLNRANRSWDGTFDGNRLPATDYWYVLKLNDNTQEIKGHFSLIR